MLYEAEGLTPLVIGPQYKNLKTFKQTMKFSLIGKLKLFTSEVVVMLTLF